MDGGFDSSRMPELIDETGADKGWGILSRKISERRDNTMQQVKIRDIRVILTAPNGVDLVVVKSRDNRAGPIWCGLCYVYSSGMRQ